MSHHHHHHHHATENDTDAIRIAFFLNAGFTVLEVIGGLLINSVAVLSDALHDLGDSFSLGLAWYLARYSEKESDAKYSYGYRRFSLLGAVINAVILILGSLYILSEAVPRLLDPENFSAPGMIAFGVLGIVVNGAAVYRLRGSGSANAQVVGWHLWEDVLGWIAVLAVGVIALFADVPILDPLLSIGITLFVLYNVVTNLRRVIELFLQAVPDQDALDAITFRLESIPGVRSTHHIHLWSLDGAHHVLSAHIVVEPDTSKEDALRIKQASRAVIRDMELEVEHLTLEVEYLDDDCSMHPCDDAPEHSPAQLRESAQPAPD